MKYDTQGVITNFTPCCKDGFGRTEGFDHLTLLLLLTIDWDRNLFRFVFFFSKFSIDLEGYQHVS